MSKEKEGIAKADTTKKNTKFQQMSSSEAFGSLGFILALIAMCLFVAVLVSLPNYPLQNGAFRLALLLGVAVAIGLVGWLCIRKANKVLEHG